MYKEKQKSNNDGSRRNRMISVEHSTYSYVSWYLSNRIWVHVTFIMQWKEHTWLLREKWTLLLSMRRNEYFSKSELN